MIHGLMILTKTVSWINGEDDRKNKLIVEYIES